METIKSKEFSKEDEKNFIVEKFLFLAREQEQTEKEMIELCCRIISDHGVNMEAAIDERKGVDMSEQGIAD